MTHPSGLLTDVQKIDILLVEYGALYALLQWRLTAADRRLFVAGALIAGVLTALHTLDVAASRLLLWALPVVLWVILSATIGHARSKEDLLRRIDEIEQRINALAGTTLLAFQSRRSNRAVAGRTGLRAVNGTLALCIVVLLGAVLFLQPAEDVHAPAAIAFGMWAAAWAGLMVRDALLLRYYTYERSVLVDPSA